MHTLTRRQLIVLAAESGKDMRTCAARLAGLPVTAASRMAIDNALRRMGREDLVRPEPVGDVDSRPSAA